MSEESDRLWNRIDFLPNGQARMYRLVDRIALPCSINECESAFGDMTLRRVALDTVKRPDSDPVTVSTVFLGVNHQWGDGPPLLFETLVTGGTFDCHMARFSTWIEAEQGHAAVLKATRAAGADIAQADREAIVRCSHGT